MIIYINRILILHQAMLCSISFREYENFLRGKMRYASCLSVENEIVNILDYRNFQNLICNAFNVIKS